MNSYVQSVCVVCMSILLSACVLLFRHVHLRPTVILSVDAHSVNGSRKNVPCCHTSAQRSSKLSPSTRTDYFQTNFENSWMVNDGPKLRKKEENFDNMCFESSKPTVEYHEYGSQDSNNVETKVKLSRMHRDTVASTKRENPGLLESSGGSGNSRCSNPSSTHPRKKSIYIYIYIGKEILREDRTWNNNIWMTDVQKTLR